MNFRHVEAFRAVMLTGSTTLAAVQLHTSQPNISRAIGLLQRETGLPLFQRVGVRIVPTPEAQALLREIDRVYVGLQSIRDAADRIRALGVDGLRVGATGAMGISLVPRVLQVFRETRAATPVVVHTADSATIGKWVASGYCDVGLAASIVLPQEVDSTLVHTERAVCIVPSGHRLAQRRKIRPADLAGEPFISMPPYDIARQQIDRLFEPEVRHLTLETSHAATICAMVARGLGVAIVNPRLQQEIGVQGLRAIAFEPSVHFHYYVVRARTRPEQAIVGDFLQAVQMALR